MNQKLNRWIAAVSVWAFIAACGGPKSESTTPPPARDGEIQSEHSHEAHGAFACPMHPEETADHAAKCSKCGMDMVQKTEHGH